MLHEQGLVEHGEALELDWAVAEGAGLGQPPPVVRRVGGGAANDGLQAPLLIVGALGRGPPPRAGVGRGQPQDLGDVGQAPPLIANPAGHRIPRSCGVSLLPAGAWAAPRTPCPRSPPPPPRPRAAGRALAAG